MAKGQVRSNREAKKPKKPKEPRRYRWQGARYQSRSRRKKAEIPEWPSQQGKPRSSSGILSGPAHATARSPRGPIG